MKTFQWSCRHLNFNDVVFVELAAERGWRVSCDYAFRIQVRPKCPASVANQTRHKPIRIISITSYVVEYLYENDCPHPPPLLSTSAHFTISESEYTEVGEYDGMVSGTPAVSPHGSEAM